MTGSLDAARELSTALALLEARIEGGFIGSQVAGLSLAVVHGTRTIFAKGFGQADIGRNRAATTHTVYGVGSITKLFTATMLMQLRDAGKLRLDDRLQDILSELPIPHRHPSAPAITLRHLVTHTSGLAKDAPGGWWGEPDFPPFEALLPRLDETEQPFQPGVQWKYSNFAIALLAHALARIAGQSWESWIAERILAPLGMTESGPRLAEAQRPYLAQGYARPVSGWPPEPLRHQDLGGAGPGGSLHATVTDMARFIAEQFAAVPTLLSRATVLEMHRVQWLDTDWQWGQGIGWRAYRAPDGGTRVEHGGGIFGYTCRVLLSPAEELGVALFTNGSNGMVGVGLTDEILDLLVPIVRRAAPPPPRAAMRPEWLPYLGHYRWVLGDVEIAVRDGALVMVSPATPSGNEGVFAMVPSGEHRFRLLGSQVIGEELRFLADDSGRITGAWAGPHPYTRL